MDNLTFSKIREAVEKYNNIAIVMPEDPSLDHMAASLSLYLGLSDIGKNVTVATPKNPLVEVSNLVGIDRVRTSLGGEGGDLVVSFPYREGEIEKVSYTRDDNYLNIVVKAGELGLNFSERDVKFSRGGSAPELLFVIGAERITDLGSLFDPATLKDTVVINIDNGAQNQGYGDIVMVSTRLSSLSEAVANLMLSLNFRIDVDIAQNLMDGIAQATSNFQDQSTSSLAFEMAGILMRSGAMRPSSAQRRNVPKADDFIRSEERKAKFEPMEEPRIDEAERKEAAPRRVVAQRQNKDQQDEQPQQNDNPPEDWLEPKIYKGSTNF